MISNDMEKIAKLEGFLMGYRNSIFENSEKSSCSVERLDLLAKKRIK